MPKRNLGQKELCLILTQLRKTADGVWWEVSLIPPTRTHLHLHRRRGGGLLQKVYPSLQYISLHLPRNLKAWNFTLVATTSCKNVETLPRKNDLSCFKSLLVTGLWDTILTSLLPPIQKCSSKFWAWSCIVSNLITGGGGNTSTKDHGQANYAKRRYSVSSTFAIGCN